MAEQVVMLDSHVQQLHAGYSQCDRQKNKTVQTVNEQAGRELLVLGMVLGICSSASTMLSNVSVVTCVARSRSPHDCVLLVVAA